MYQYQQFAILLRGGGDIATGIALRLYRSGFRRLINSGNGASDGRKAQGGLFRSRL